MENKNKDRGFNYWAMSYRGKLRRTLWMFPFGVLAIALIAWTSGSVFITVMVIGFIDNQSESDSQNEVHS